jgi:hypothetical protein
MLITEEGKRPKENPFKNSAVLPLDSRAWQEEMVYIRERARLQEALGRQRGWTREELYDERFQRFSR